MLAHTRESPGDFPTLHGRPRWLGLALVLAPRAAPLVRQQAARAQPGEASRGVVEKNLELQGVVCPEHQRSRPAREVDATSGGIDARVVVLSAKSQSYIVGWLAVAGVGLVPDPSPERPQPKQVGKRQVEELCALLATNPVIGVPGSIPRTHHRRLSSLTPLGDGSWLISRRVRLSFHAASS